MSTFKTPGDEAPVSHCFKHKMSLKPGEQCAQCELGEDLPGILIDPNYMQEPDELTTLRDFKREAMEVIGIISAAAPRDDDHFTAPISNLARLSVSWRRACAFVEKWRGK